jgi:hypothetical protein
VFTLLICQHHDRPAADAGEGAAAEHA